MHAGPKFTNHAHIRAIQRTDISMWKISECLRNRTYYGLPKQTHNKRVAIITEGDEAVVAIYTKSTKEILTVMPLGMYIERHPEIRRDYDIERFLKKEEARDAATARISA